MDSIQLLRLRVLEAFMRHEAVALGLLVLLDDEYVQEAVVAQHRAQEPDPALHEGPDLDGVPLLEAAPEDEVEVPSPLTIVGRVLLHRDMSSSLAPAWKSTRAAPPGRSATVAPGELDPVGEDNDLG